MALIGATAVLVLAGETAWAKCAVAPSGVLACEGAAKTRRAVNVDGSPAGATDRTQLFDDGTPIEASIARHAVVKKSGLRLTETGAAPTPITLDDQGSIKSKKSGQTLRIDGNGGAVAYSGNGRVTNGRKKGAALSIDSGGGALSIATGGGLVEGGRGIVAKAAAGNLAITTGTGEVKGTHGQGIDAQTSSGTLDVTTGRVAVSGHGKQAIRTSAVDGHTTIVVGGAVKNGGTSTDGKAPPALRASSDGSGSIFITGPGTVSSKAGRGIWAQEKRDGLGGITIGGTGATEGLGKLCPGGHPIAARIHGEVGCSGIRAVIKNPADNQDILIDRSGTVKATSAAMDAFTFGNGNITIVPGRDARLKGGEFGIETMTSGSGDVTVATTGARAAIRTAGTGILAENAATAVPADADSRITVTNEGRITSTGKPFDSRNRRNYDHDLAAIAVGYLGGASPSPNGNGNVDGSTFVSNQGVLRARHGTGILAFGMGRGTVSVANGGAIDARTGVALFGGPDVRGTISNTGDITGRPVALDLTHADATTVDQRAGRIRGDILLSGTGDTINVTGGAIDGRIIAKPGADGTDAGTVDFDAAAFRTGGTIAAANVDVTGGTLILADGITGAVDNRATLRIGGTRPRAIDGTYAQAGNAALAVPIGPTGSGRLSVTGPADLSGTLDVLVRRGPGGRFVPSGSYTVLTADGGITGGFTRVAVVSRRSLPSPLLAASPTSVTVTFPERRPLAALAVTPTQAATAAALQDLPARSPLRAAIMSEDAAGTRQAFDATSGSLYASTLTAQFEDARLVREAVLDRLQDADPVSAPGFWGRSFGDFGRNGGDGHAATVDRSVGGFVLGADAPLSGAVSAWRVGVAGAYTSDAMDADPGSTAVLSTGLASLYAGARYGAWEAQLGVAAGGTSLEADRTLSFPGYVEGDRAGARAFLAEGFGELGYRFGLGRAVLEPLLTGAAIHIAQSGFVEQGGAAALAASGGQHDLGTTTLGWRGEIRPFRDLPLVAHALLGWQHAYGDVAPRVLLGFAAGSSRFLVAGVPIDRDALSAQAGVAWHATDTLALGIDYSGLMGTRAEDQSIEGKIALAF